MTIIVDRIEDGIVVCEGDDGAMYNLDINDVEPGVSEGDILLPDEGVYKIDREATEKRRKKISELYRSVFSED